MKSILLKFLKELNWKFLLGLGIFCLLCAIANNLRVSDEKSVDWIGSQEILEKPEDVL
ncbi:MAG: hypothetical protein J6A06_01655 [Fibrobacteraceae bacterium]|jgi:hypothetical protein|nr:hypothetical protein [Fibrobacteraceae bacterium]MEE1067828.1 hypothetical protein [Fibrobacteraceae bacterium]